MNAIYFRKAKSSDTYRRGLQLDSSHSVECRSAPQPMQHVCIVKQRAGDGLSVSHFPITVQLWRVGVGWPTIHPALPVE